MIKKGIIITLVVVFLISSVPYTTAQSVPGIFVAINSQRESGDYNVVTSKIRVDGSLRNDGFIDNPIFNFVNATREFPIEEVIWYDFALSAIFEANDTNKDGVFTLGVDQLVGAIIPFSRRWDSWNYSDFLLEKEGEEGYPQVIHEPEFFEMDELTGMHVNYTANITTSHWDRLVVHPDDWPSVRGHTRTMHIEIMIGVHISSATPDQFMLEFQLTGWDWMYEDSILVFIFSPYVRFDDSLDPDLDALRNFAAINHEGNRMYFGGGYIEYPQIVSAGNGTDQVEVNATFADIDHDYWNPHYGSDVTSIFTAFENFGDNTLDYTLNLGVVSVEFPDIHATPTTPVISYRDLLLTASIISLVTIAIILYRNEKNSIKGKTRKPRMNTPDKYRVNR
ncbi:MAG: hypothetical protein ACFFF4_17375 [Candidatus Thorarchaeota archaeon]